MIWFSYLYLGSRFVVMDVQEDRTLGYRTYVAALSEDPRVCFRALTAQDALAKLAAHLRGPVVTFMPEPPVNTPCLERSGA
jgi:hypothetical protein